MKTVIIALSTFLFALLSFFQKIISEKTRELPDGRVVTLVSTPIGTSGPSYLENLTPNHEKYKFFLQDSINRKDFEVKYYLEEYQNDSLLSKFVTQHPSAYSSYISELIIDRMTNNMILIILQVPGYTRLYYIPSLEEYNPLVALCHYKWKIFSDMSFNNNTPVFLIYNENQEDDVIEKKIDGLFQSLSFKNLKDKDKIVQQIKSVSNNFYILFYDVIPN